MVAGLPVHLGLTVSRLSDLAPYTVTPLVGARVEIWSSIPQGVYSDEASESTTGENYSWGCQVTNAHGIVNFLTVFPGWYSGRTPHIHFRIGTNNAAGTVTYNYTAQVFFNETITAQVYHLAAYARAAARDTYNATDRVFNGDSHNGSPATEAGDDLLLTMANAGTFVAGTFHIVIDPSDTANDDPTGGSETGGGGRGPPSSRAAITQTRARSSATKAPSATPARPRVGGLRSKRYD